MKMKIIAGAQSTEQGLRQILTTAGVQVEDWGTGKAKTIAHLTKELADGETTLVEWDGKVVRLVRVTRADIFFDHPERGLLKLVELKQVFRDGRERVRDLPVSLAEKIVPGEDPATAIIRGIREELRIMGNLIPLHVESIEEVNVSPSYPGLESVYELHRFRVDLTPNQFDPSGYVEEQPDKSTIFGWRPHTA